MGNKSQNVISIWGPPAAGKTVVAARLASFYAKKENVVLLLCDPLISGISQLLTEEESEKQRGRTLGHLLPIPSMSISEKALLRECLVTKQENLALLGYRYRETAAGSFSIYGEELAKQLISMLRVVADRVVIDCSNDVLSDLLSTVALSQSDRNVMVCGAEPKHMVYYDTMMPVFSDSQYGMEHQIKVLNQIWERQEITYAQEKYGEMDLVVPFSEELFYQWNEKGMLREHSPIDGMIEKLAKKIDHLDMEETEEGVTKKGRFYFLPWKKRNNPIKLDKKKIEKEEGIHANSE